MQKKNIFISFIEEAVMNPEYQGYIGGRIEVSHPGDHYPSEEIRFFTNNTERFYTFREKWDWKKITNDDLDILRKIVQLYFIQV